MRPASIITNYRPISLLCCLSKILKRLYMIFDKSYDFIVKSSISDSQFWFVRNRSTLHQLLLYSEFLYNAYDNWHAASWFIFVKLSILSLMQNFCLNYGMLASLVISGVSSKPIFPTDNNVLLSPATSQNGVQLLLECLREVFLAPCYLSFLLTICPWSLLSQCLTYLLTTQSAVPKSYLYLTALVFKMT